MAEFISVLRLLSLRNAAATMARSASASLACTRRPLVFCSSDCLVAAAIWCATMSLAVKAWVIRWRRSWPRNIQDRVNTTRNTSPVIASTSLVFNRIGESCFSTCLCYSASRTLRARLWSCHHRPKYPRAASPQRAVTSLVAAKRLYGRPILRPITAAGAAVLFQLVVQRLQADAQNLGGTGLIVARGLQGF